MEFWICDQIILGFIRRKIMCSIGRTFLKKKNYQRNMFLKRLTWMMKWNSFTDSTKYFEQHVAGGGAVGDGSGLQVEVGNTHARCLKSVCFYHTVTEKVLAPYPAAVWPWSQGQTSTPWALGSKVGLASFFGGLTSKSCITLIEFYHLQVNHTPAQTPGGRKLGSPGTEEGLGSSRPQ